EDYPWCRWNRGGPISARQVAGHLRPFGIAPRSIRLPSGETPKGYMREWFEEAFSRYLPPESDTTPQDAGGAGSDFVRETPRGQGCGGSEEQETPRPDGPVALWRQEGVDENTSEEKPAHGDGGAQ